MAKQNIFISYSAKDSDIAQALIKDLDKRGIYVWKDRDIAAGEKWMQKIEKALREAEYFIFLLTPDFLASEWSNVEMGVALSRQATSENIQIIPIMLRDVRLPYTLSAFTYLDAREDDISLIGEKISEIIRKT